MTPCRFETTKAKRSSRRTVMQIPQPTSLNRRRVCDADRFVTRHGRIRDALNSADQFDLNIGSLCRRPLVPLDPDREVGVRWNGRIPVTALNATIALAGELAGGDPLGGL